MQASIPINNHTVCSSKFNTYDQSTQLCAGDINQRKDACRGDSGSPLMKKLDGSWTLVGLVSYGDQNCNGYGVYTRISEYYDWIMKNK